MKAPRNFTMDFSNRVGSKTSLDVQYNTDGNTIYTARKVQDVEPVLEFAKLISDTNKGELEEGDRVLGEIPLAIWGEMLLDGRAEDPAAIRKWLAEHSLFKVWNPSAIVKGNL